MLEVRDVDKIYEPPTGLLKLLVRAAAKTPVRALEPVSFSATAGEVVGIVGPNGAGKSTLIRILANLVAPTSGSVVINAAEVDPRDTTHPAVGLLLGDERALYWRLTGRQNLEFFGAIAGLTKAEAARRADTLLTEAGLAQRDRLVLGYSAGMRVQLGLARALMHDPSLLILDEPSRSLDPVASTELLARLRERADTGKTILLSSHRLDEVEQLCDRVLVIIDGTQRYWGPTADLRTATAGPAAALRAILEESETP